MTAPLDSAVPAHLRLRDLAWRAGPTTVLDGVDLDLAPGGLTGLLGPNGSGKSTLLSLVAGQRRPSSGTVHLDGEDLRRVGPGARARRVALVEQQATTELELRAEDVVDLGRTPHRARWASRDPSAEAVVAAAMARTDVTHLWGRRWSTLSGGERQRVHLARALAQQPALLLLDEPTNHLDLGHQLALMRLVGSLSATTLAALHDLPLAAAFCDRVAVLHGGRLVACGPPAEVLTSTLLADVFGVRADVTPHPRTGRPHVVWDPDAPADVPPGTP